MDSRESCRVLATSKPSQEGQLLVLSSRKWARIFSETISVVAHLLCGVFCRVVLRGRPTHSSVSA